MKTICKKLVLFSAVFALIFGALFAAFPRTAHAAGELTLNKPGLELSVGESDLLTADGGDVVWSSADENIATVSKSGVVKGVSVGETSVTGRPFPFTSSNGSAVSTKISSSPCSGLPRRST